jgi:hypothetical protein
MVVLAMMWVEVGVWEAALTLHGQEGISPNSGAIPCFYQRIPIETWQGVPVQGCLVFWKTTLYRHPAFILMEFRNKCTLRGRPPFRYELARDGQS